MKPQENTASDAFDDDEDEDSMDIETLGSFAYGLNDAHYIRFKRRGPALLVSFETETGSMPLSERPSRFADLADEMDWSTLTLISKGDTWFRDAEVINFFDALVDGTLLDQFDDVLFYGQGSGGHGALSFALTAPGARVLALAPHMGFGMPGAPIDTRFSPPDTMDFAERYAVIPENLATARAVWLLHDPNQPQDRAHSEAISPANALMCRNMGSDIETGLTELRLLDEMVVRAMEGDLDQIEFYRALRVRRDDPAWLRRLIARLIKQNRPVLEALAVRNVAQRTGRHRFSKRFQQIEAELNAKGITIPDAQT
ncbi:hypothetical protein [Oceaniglobus ichthyenteri]|uniref:hypothetical protein n=1 Tax=Oceaniglobus ichthyenteri TaxID=2136177 RepID=UPI000D3CDEBA|nr:hypothetical protein [Oceaniglobus ichthyenteri]